MLRAAFLIAVLGIGLTLLSGSGFSRDRHAAPTPNWGMATSSQPARHAPPVAPRNWATPR